MKISGFNGRRSIGERVAQIKGYVVWVYRSWDPTELGEYYSLEEWPSGNWRGVKNREIDIWLDDRYEVRRGDEGYLRVYPRAQHGSYSLVEALGERIAKVGVYPPQERNF